ncbi:MAG: PKD domain-containing protein [Bacteroidia bacterium]
METTRGTIIIGELKATPKTLSKFLLLFFFFISLPGRSQLVINEVSQGSTGSKEYVELVVVGTPTCTTIPCFDLRGYIIDDNNGTFATGAGTGIANGCIKLSNDVIWSCVPAGTIILIYNDADLNPMVPANDFSLTDGNCVLVMPISNCTYFTKNATTPTVGTSTYPTTGFTACGNWNEISMANAGDSFQTLDGSGNLLHAVSWGNNSTSTIIYFAAGQGGNVCLNTNGTDLNPANQANWVSVAIAGNETPGAPNNAANAAWINSMSNNCNSILPLTLSFNSTQTVCGCTGSTTVTASGAVGPYTYTWSPGGSNLDNIGSLCVGNYSVSVNSSNGCLVTNTVSVTSTTTLTTVMTHTNVTCNGSANGLANVAVGGSAGPFSYTWSPAGGNAANASNLPPGSYTVNVSNAGGCTTIDTVSISEPTVLTSTLSSTNSTCFGANNGSATVTASGGTGAYSYTWSPSGGSSSIATGLGPGNYSATVSDANGCTITTATTITEPSILSLTVSSTSVTCNGLSNGSASVSASGGTGAYSYTWSPAGGNFANAPGLAAGNYSITVSDANGCPATTTVAVSQPTTLTATITTTDALCFGTNGSATVTAGGGTGAYTYSWSPSGGTGSTATFPQGTYSVTVKDGNNCSVTSPAVINEPAVLTSTIASTNITCFGANDGTANITGSGGTGAYTYSWSPAGGTNSNAGGLSPNTYSATITDGNGCTVTTSITITEPSILSLTISSTSVTCNGLSNGTATVSASGGTGAYSYTWSPSGGNSASASGLAFGTYTATVNDANGCVATGTTSIDQPSALSATITSTDALCFGTNGSATVTAGGGTGAYTYSWSPVGGTGSTATLPQGNYSVTITDANGCSIATSSTINQPAALTATISSTNITCFGANNGSATISGNGGTGAYTYSWSPGGVTNSNATGLSPNTYSATITDGNGCTITKTTTITEPSILSLTASSTSVTCNGLSNGTASVSASGGTGAYSYTWSPAGGNSANAGNLSSGTYTATVSDANGCLASATTTVNQPLPLTVTVTNTPANCSTNNGIATANASGGTGAYTYTWSPSGGNSSNASGLAGGTYSVTIKDANNCTANGNTTIFQPPSFSLSISSTSVTCNGGDDGSLTANIVGGTAPFVYAWSPSGGTNPTTGAILSAGVYTLNVSDAGSCSLTATATINQPAPVTVSANGQSVCNGANASLTAVGAGGTGPYTYAWSPGGGTGSPLSVSTTVNATYTVIATDSKGCVSQSDTAMINVLPALNITVASSDTTCAGMPATLTAFAGGGNGNYTITWSPGGATGNTIHPAPNTTTIYTATVSDGCSVPNASATGQVIVQLNPGINFNPNPASGCAPVCVTFAAAASSVSGNNIVSYSWNFGDGGTAAGINASHCYTSSGNFNVYLLGITEKGCRDSVVKTSLITVYPQPVADFGADNFTTDIYDPKINFQDLSTGNVNNWNWNFHPGTSTVQNPSHTFLSEGTYQVTLIVKNGNGCSDTVTKEVVINPVYTFYAPNAMTPNSDGMNEVFLPTGTAWNNSTFNLWIFDRWGNQILHSKDANQGWDGKRHGETVQQDVYVWKVELEDIFGRPHEYNGTISIIR